MASYFETRVLKGVIAYLPIFPFASSIWLCIVRIYLSIGSRGRGLLIPACIAESNKWEPFPLLREGS